MELWLIDPVTRAYLEAIRNDDEMIRNSVADGQIAHADNAQLTQSAYFENLGLRQGLGRAANPVNMIEKWFDVEQGESNE